MNDGWDEKFKTVLLEKVNTIIVFNVIGSTKKFCYPAIVNVIMGLDHAYDLLYSPALRDFLPKEQGPTGFQVAGDVARKGIIENLILNLMNRTKTRFNKIEGEEEEKK